MASLDMAPWAAPELTGLHRVPMHSVPHEDQVPLDGEWRFQLLPAADATATEAWRCSVMGKPLPIEYHDNTHFRSCCPQGNRLN